PKFAPAHKNLGNALMQKGDVGEAISHYRQALELDPKYATAHVALGQALNHQGKQVEAMDCYTKALELNPKDAITHNNFAWLLATCADVRFRDPARAVVLATKALDLDP